MCAKVQVFVLIRVGMSQSATRIGTMQLCMKELRENDIVANIVKNCTSKISTVAKSMHYTNRK